LISDIEMGCLVSSILPALGRRRTYQHVPLC
jgi:hypothetical protein